MVYLSEGVYDLDLNAENSMLGNELIDALISDIIEEQTEKELNILEEGISSQFKFSLRHRIKMKLFFMKLRIISLCNNLRLKFRVK